MEFNEKKKICIKSICSTAYKTLLLLKYFLVMPLTKEQIRQLFLSDKIVSQEISDEILRNALNSLKVLGCDFSRPKKSNGYKYELIKNPFSLKLSKSEADLLNKFRKNPFMVNNWQNILATNALINKIALSIDEKDIIENLKNHSQLNNIDENLIKELHKYCVNGNEITLTYMSGKNIAEFELVASFLKYERGRLYIWGYSPKYDDFSYLRVDKIKSVKVVNISKGDRKIKHLTIRYKNFNKNHVLADNEVLVEKTDDALIIDYQAENKFYTIQKFLEMGCDCEILSPALFRKEFIDTLKAIKEVYDDEG